MSGRLSWVLAFVVLAVSGASWPDRRRRLQRAVTGPVPATPSRPAPTRCAPSSPAVTACPRSSWSPAATAAPLTPARCRRHQAASGPPMVSADGGRGGHRAAGRRAVRFRAQRRGQGTAARRPPTDCRRTCGPRSPADPAFGADIANSFAGANITLLAVTAAVVALLLIVTYRSPVLWLVPLAVIGFADRVAAVVGTCGRRRGRHEPRRVDVGHHQRAGVRGGHQLCAAADLALSRGVGPQRRSPRTRCASRCARPDRRSSPATRPSCWRC